MRVPSTGPPPAEQQSRGPTDIAIRENRPARDHSLTMKLVKFEAQQQRTLPRWGRIEDPAVLWRRQRPHGVTVKRYVLEGFEGEGYSTSATGHAMAVTDAISLFSRSLSA
jgi:hypothetical protein